MERKRSVDIFDNALIQPPRGVLDIHMGNYASGGR